MYPSRTRGALPVLKTCNEGAPHSSAAIRFASPASKDVERPQANAACESVQRVRQEGGEVEDERGARNEEAGNRQTRPAARRGAEQADCSS